MLQRASDNRDEGKDKSEGLEDKFIIRRIQTHVDNGINGEDGDVSQVRQSMYSRYLGDLFGNEREGFSKFVTREVLEAIEWAIPALIRVFMGGVAPVEFRPRGPEDVEQAAHESAVVSYYFFEGGNGFVAFYSWVKDILMYPNGYIMITPEEENVTETKSFEAVTQEQIEGFEEQAEAAGKDIDVTIDNEITLENGEKVYDITLALASVKKSVIIAPIPPDHCIVERKHHALDLDDCPFVCIREQKTYSELRKLGYEAEDLEDLAPDGSETWNDEAVTRHFYSDEQPGDEDGSFDIQADEEYWVHTCYMHIDVDQDGISEPRKIVMVGCKIIENEVLDYMPAVAATAILQTHKHIGMGYAEIVADLQELLTTLNRQLLDNIYKQNVQRTYVNEQALLSDGSTMDAMLDGEAEFVTVRGSPQEAIYQEQITPIVAEIATVIEQFKEKPALRTGVSPQISLDPDILQKSTMGAFLGALDQASQRLELLARLLAETALKKAFQKVHYVLRTYHDKPQPIQIKGRWVTPDPSKWSARSDMSVNVGLGFNNKQMMLALLQQLLMIQKEAAPQGLADPKTIYTTLEKLIEQANLGHASSYFLDPRQPGWKAPPPPKDPAMISAEAQAKALEAEAERKSQELKFKHDEVMAKIEADKEVAVEKAKLEAAKANQALMEHKETVRLNDAKIAELDAKITSLNRGDKNQAGPAESSSQDEFGRARSSREGGTAAPPATNGAASGVNSAAKGDV